MFLRDGRSATKPGGAGTAWLLIGLAGLGLAACDRTLDYCVSNRHELRTLEVGEHWAPRLGTLDASHSQCLPLDRPSPFEWRSEGEAALAVAPDGSVEALGPGTFELIALDAGEGVGLGLTGQVLPEGWGLVVAEPEPITLTVGEQRRLALDAQGADGVPVTELWIFATSDQPGIVAQRGCLPLNRGGECRLEGIRAGTATLRVSMGRQRVTRAVVVEAPSDDAAQGQSAQAEQQ